MCLLGVPLIAEGALPPVQPRMPVRSDKNSSGPGRPLPRAGERLPLPRFNGVRPGDDQPLVAALSVASYFAPNNLLIR
jgi:hypothetical protein